MVICKVCQFLFSSIFQFLLCHNVTKIAHVIQEIGQLQQGSYNIEPIAKIINYLLDPSLQIDDDTLYQMSLEIEPRSSKPSSSLFHLTSSVAHKSKK
ncbi:hypothetical protein E2986_12247 [Frieseomelitta varia]|uniref:Uncharacterized protein n=1 Tax=Frieseomelitta varia TaxID=561572 RepID=A0A833RPV4_9HYME|nr:hypothetical protein E2986_12247 [Frieseomelitta varia]